VYAGRLSPEKTPQSVIDAVDLLTSRGVSVRMDVYGHGGEHTAWRRQASRLPVVFHGFIGDRGELVSRLAAADVAFAPSAAETFGLSVLEALACGTPVDSLTPHVPDTVNGQRQLYAIHAQAEATKRFLRRSDGAPGAFAQLVR
jgi:alpha-1,6-mannosyltransferase